MAGTIPKERLTRELAYRANDGLEVSLRWSKSDGTLVVLVVDSKAGDSFELAVESAKALDVFNHPYAYAAVQGVSYRVATRVEPEALYA